MVVDLFPNSYDWSNIQLGRTMKSDEKSGIVTPSPFLTVKQFSETYSWPTQSAMRAIILAAQRKENKFGKAFKKVGKRILIDVEEFWKVVSKS